MRAWAPRSVKRFPFQGAGQYAGSSGQEPPTICSMIAVVETEGVRGR